MVRDIRVKTVRLKERGQNLYPYSNSWEGIKIAQISSYDRTHGFTPGFRKSASKHSARPVVPMRLVKQTLSAHQFNWERFYPDGTRTGYGSGQPSVELCPNRGYDDFPEDLLVNADERAISRFRKKSVGLKAELGIMLAEAHKSANLIAENAVRALGGLRALVRGDITGVVRWLGLDSVAHGDSKRVTSARNRAARRDIAGAWLELQYGWKPLLHDIRDSLDLLEQTFAGGRPLAKIAGSATIRHYEDLHDARPGIITDGGWSCSVTVKYGGLVGVQDPGSYALQSLGITNPASLAWELVPYSFVVDWILPVGKYLEHLNELDGLVLYNGYRVELVKSLCKSRFVLTPAPYEYTLLTGGVPRLERTGFVYDVQKVSTFPPDATASWPPKLKGWLEGTNSPLTRITNALALTLSAFDKRR